MSYERLTVRFNQTIEMKKCDHWNNCANCSDFKGCPKIYDAISRLVELEDKIEIGTLVELPFKIGTLVYVIYTNWETGELDVRMTDVVGYEIMRGELWVKTSIPYRKCYIEIENVFRTQAEAEAKLKELMGE